MSKKIIVPSKLDTVYSVMGQPQSLDIDQLLTEDEKSRDDEIELLKRTICILEEHINYLHEVISSEDMALLKINIVGKRKKAV